MLSSRNNVTRGSATMSSAMPPLPQCLSLEPIMLGTKKYTRSGELRRVLGFPLGSLSEGHSFSVAHPKPPPPVATEELKHFKESMQDASRKARDRAKMLRESILKLEKYREALSSKKRQRTDLSSNERPTGVVLMKLGSQIHKNPHETMSQRFEDRAKSVGLNKRVRTSLADVRVDRADATLKKQVGPDKDESSYLKKDKDETVLQAGSGDSIRSEEKTRRLLAGGEGLDQKIKKKRSVGAVSNRILASERDIKRPTHAKLSSDCKLRSCDAQGFRLKSSIGVGGTNKSDGSFEPTNHSTCTTLKNELENAPVPKDRSGSAVIEQKIVLKGNIKLKTQEDNPVGSSNTVVRGKVSRAPRTGSVLNLDSSPNFHPSSGALQGCKQPSAQNKVQVAIVTNNQKRAISDGSSIHPMAQWVGQRPHKNSRMRRTKLVPPVSKNPEAQVSYQGPATSDFSARTSSAGTNGSQHLSCLDNQTANSKREHENISSPYALSGSEESGAGENQLKEKGRYSSDNAFAADHNVGAHFFPIKKNKIPNNEVKDGVLRQGRSGRGPSFARPGIPPVMDKPENAPAAITLQCMTPVSDKNKSKTGRPPPKKLKDRKSSTFVVGSVTPNGSSDFTGESDDDHDELYSAATSAHNASKLACSGPFWKKIESVFGSPASEDITYLQQQLSFSEELGESLSQILLNEYNILFFQGVFMPREFPNCSGERQGKHCHQDSLKADASCGKFDMRKLEDTSLYQRVLSALIVEDQSAELYLHSEEKDTHLPCASDDSHCGSCNVIDVEPKDRDRIESDIESKVDFQTQQYCVLDRHSCDRSAATNIFWTKYMSTSRQTHEQWMGDDDISHSDVKHASEICPHDLGQLQPSELNTSSCHPSDCQYQLMSLDDRLLLELQSIGLCPEKLPDLREGEEVIIQDLMGLNQGLHQQIGRKKKKLAELDIKVQKERAAERRRLELVAMNQLIEMAYRKWMAFRGSNGSKNAGRKVSRQVAFAFLKRTLGRCRQREEKGISCFSDPALQNVIFSEPSCNNAAKSVECVGSGTASSTCIEDSQKVEIMGSGAVSSGFERHESDGANLDRGLSGALHADINSSGQASSTHGPILNLNKDKKREMLISDDVGSGFSMETLALDSAAHKVNKKRSEKDKELKLDNLGDISPSAAGRMSLDSSRSERKTKAKSKQNNTQLARDSVPNPGNKKSKPALSFPGNTPAPSSKEVNEPTDFPNLQPDELEENQDLSTWLNFDEDGLQDHDSIGLEIPMDDLSELMLM